MAQSKGFYLTLPSDGSMQTFLNNIIYQFKTLLPQHIDLTDGEWEVALTEMMYGTSIILLRTFQKTKLISIF